MWLCGEQVQLPSRVVFSWLKGVPFKVLLVTNPGYGLHPKKSVKCWRKKLKRRRWPRLVQVVLRGMFWPVARGPTCFTVCSASNTDERMAKCSEEDFDRVGIFVQQQFSFIGCLSKNPGRGEYRCLLT